MKKIGLILLAVIILLIGGYFVLSNQQNSNIKIDSQSSKEASLTQPDRQAEINGYVLSIEGNELIIANEQGVKEITDEEKARRQKLTQEERQALKAQESANLTKENLTIIIPVGTNIVKGKGDVSGENIKSDLSEITKGIYLSIWQANNQIEMVKVKGTSQ